MSYAVQLISNGELFIERQLLRYFLKHLQLVAFRMLSILSKLTVPTSGNFSD